MTHGGWHVFWIRVLSDGMLVFTLKSAQHVILSISAVWLVVFAFHERILPWMSALYCGWPSLVSDNGVNDPGVNVLLVADPQLIDNHTYPGRNSLLLSLSKHTVDTYLNKNYRALVTTLKPDYIFWLGDLFDNGRNSTDEYYLLQLMRFNLLFYDKYQRKYSAGINWFANVPGNHDLGFGDGVRVDYRNRFRETFGKPNSIKQIHNVEFVMLDSVSISSKDPSINSEAFEFLSTLNSVNPRILLSHVPFYRDESVTCGPKRESAKFNGNGFGYQYKNSLDQQLSKKLLKTIHPNLIFSGDDHDYCDIFHEESPRRSREITVKSISMAMGIKYPAVQLLTFRNKNNDFHYNTEICYLPTPYYNVACYIILAVLSAVAIVAWNLKRKVLGTGLPTYKKVNKFLKDQDSENTESLFTPLSYIKKEVEPVMQKYCVVSIAHQCALLGMVVILLYIVFCVTI